VIVAIAVGRRLKRGKATRAGGDPGASAASRSPALSFVLQTMTDWRLSIFGVITLFVVYYLQDGIVGFVRNALNISAEGRAQVPTRRRAARRVATTPGDARRDAEATGVLMQFGGLKALNNVDLASSAARIHGLIGPNGSGKSTMMNVLTGIYVPTAGTIAFAGDRWSAAPRPTSRCRGLPARSRTCSCSAR
jgi:branched-chain amino acid transport system permease protein